MEEEVLLSVKDLAKKYYCSLEVARTMLARSEVAKWTRISKQTKKYTICKFVWSKESEKDFDYVFGLKGCKRDV